MPSRPTDETLRVDGQGHWLQGDTALAGRIAEQFARHIEPKSDGRYELTWNKQRQAIDVDDTPFFVRNFSIDCNGKTIEKIELTVSDGRTETLNPATLMQAGEHILYCRIVRNGLSVPCRFSSSMYHLFAQHLEASEGNYVLMVAGEAYQLQSYDSRPQRLN